MAKKKGKKFFDEMKKAAKTIDSVLAFCSTKNCRKVEATNHTDGFVVVLAEYLVDPAEWDKSFGTRSDGFCL